MPSIPDILGVQSFCFRGFKENEKVAQLVRDIGVDRIELCGVHADFNDPAAFKDVVKVYEDAGVKMVSIGVQTFVGDPAERQWFESAQAAGAKHISAHFRVDNFQTSVPATVRLAEEFGIRVGIHCHGGYMFGGSPDVISHLIGLGGGHIGLCIDTAWAMQIGPRNGDPLKWVEQFKDSLFGVHIKDFVFDRSAQWTDVVVGTGNLKLPEFLAALHSANFDGMCVLEYEGDVNDPVPALKDCVRQVHEASK